MERKKVLKNQNAQVANKPKLNWIDRCYEETMFPNPNWDTIQDKIGTQLAVSLNNRLEDDVSDEITRQVLFSLLGRNYIDNYLPSFSVDGSVLKSRNLPDAEHAKISQAMKKLIEAETKKAFEELGYGSLSRNEIKDYRNDVQHQFTGTLQEELTVNRNLGKNGEKAVNVLGKALMKILHRDPQSIMQLANRLKEQVLPMPNTLRKCVYVHQLIRMAEDKDDSVPRDVMELKKELKEYLEESKKNGKLQQIKAENWKKIDKAVIDVYHTSRGLRGIDTDEHLMTTSRILNLLQKANGNYRKSLVYWLCPFLLAFESHSSLLKDEAVIEVAALFNLADRFFIPTHAQIFSIATRAVDFIIENDRQFYNHLSATMKIDPIFRPEDLTLEVLHVEREKAKDMLTEALKNRKSQKSIKIITNLQTYVRRWVAEGLINNLRLEGALFLWDQLFYVKWDSNYVSQAILVVMMLLKPWFMRADSHSDIRQVFIEEPARLYTADIRRAWRHLGEKRPIEELSSMNRNILLQNDSPPPPPAVYTPPEPPLCAPVPVVTNLPESSDDDDSESELEVLKVSESEDEHEPQLIFEPESKPEPEPVSRHELVPDLEKRPDILDAWLPFNKAVKMTFDSNRRMNAPFDLYIDAIRFLPDNATIAKVTGKILNTGDDKSNETPDIVAYPALKSPGKFPEFKFKLPVRSEQILLNPNVLLLLRVYAVEPPTNELVILGTCLFSLFKNKPSKSVKLRVGGHQARLRRGFPKGNSKELSESDMDENIPIPCSTILFRILPHSVEFIDMPSYDTHYYRSKTCEPNESECNIYEDYMQRPDINNTVYDVVVNNYDQGGKRFNPRVNNDSKVEAFIKQSLERPNKTKPRQINLDSLIKYNIKYGLALLAEEAHRLPVLMSGKFFHVALQVLPGKKTLREKTFTILSEKLEMESSHLDPNWLDVPTKVHPEYDENAVLFVQLFGLNMDYVFPKGNRGGFVKDKDSLHIDLATPLAWTAIPLFKNGAVNVGTYLAPLIKYYPTKRIVQALQTQSVEKIFKNNTDEFKFQEGSSIEVTLWDGHYLTDECPPLTKSNHLVKLVPKHQKYLKAIDARNETSFIDLLIDRKVQKEGPESWIIGTNSTRVQQDFLRNLNFAFVRLINEELEKRGLEPIVQGGVDDNQNSSDESDAE